MTLALFSILTALSADAVALGAAQGFDVHTGRAPEKADPPAVPYVVLAPSDTEAESIIQPDTERDTAPTDVLLTANVYGSLPSALRTAEALQARWLSDAVGSLLEAHGRTLLGSEIAQSLPLPSGDVDSKTYGRRIGVRFTTEPVAATV